MEDTLKTLQIVHFGLGILSFLLIIYLNYRRLEEVENGKQN
ncbi:hypothetical protein [Raineya sp.]